MRKLIIVAHGDNDGLHKKALKVAVEAVEHVNKAKVRDAWIEYGAQATGEQHLPPWLQDGIDRIEQLEAKLQAAEQERNAVARDLRSRSEQLDRSEPLLERYREALERIESLATVESVKQTEIARQALSDPDEES